MTRILTAEDVDKINARNRAYRVSPLGKWPADKGGRPKIGEGFRKRDQAKRRAYRKSSDRIFQSERAVKEVCQDVLEAHPFVAFWWRQNTGAMRLGPRFIKFSFKGASDLMAQAVDGRFIAIETKATGKLANDDQAAFLSNVAAHNGYSVCIDDAGNLKDWLDGLMAGQKQGQV